MKIANALLAAALGIAMALQPVTTTPAANDISETVTMHRMYNPNSGEHFYTSSMKERENLVKAGWSYEGVGWEGPVESKTPVYRLYNPNSGDHHYTTIAGERDKLVKVGWNYEGIGWYSDDSETIPVYRQYNPNAKTGAHNFTTSKVEKDALVRAGWKAEGIAWYASGKGADDGTKADSGETSDNSEAIAAYRKLLDNINNYDFYGNAEQNQWIESLHKYYALVQMKSGDIPQLLIGVNVNSMTSVHDVRVFNYNPETKEVEAPSGFIAVGGGDDGIAGMYSGMLYCSSDKKGLFLASTERTTNSMTVQRIMYSPSELQYSRIYNSGGNNQWDDYEIGTLPEYDRALEVNWKELDDRTALDTLSLTTSART